MKIKLKLASTKYLSILFYILLLLSNVSGQKETIQTPSIEEFDKIYDVIFPKTTKSFDAKNHEYSIDIRVAPSFRSPSQLSITKFQDGHFEINRYDLRNREQSLFEQLISLPDYGKEKNFMVLATSLEVERKKPKDLPLIKSQLNEFYKNINFCKETDFTLDGVSYEIWYTDQGTNFYFSQVGSEKYEKDESNLISFIRKIMNISEK